MSQNIADVKPEASNEVEMDVFDSDANETPV